jgi:trimethylamine---corrinoid protein Co-methyltransferase
LKLSLKFYLFIFESQHNNSYEQWDMEGRLDSEAVGVRKAQKWLAKYEAPPIDQALDEALLEFIARRSREIPLG